MAELQQRHSDAAKKVAQQPTVNSRDAQRRAASQQLNQVAQRNNYRGYDTDNSIARREAGQKTAQRSTTPKQQQQREQVKERAQQHPVSQQQRDTARQRVESSTPEQLQAFRQNRANAFSGNDSRSPNWQSQQLRDQESRRVSQVNLEQRAGAREARAEHHEFRRR